MFVLRIYHHKLNILLSQYETITFLVRMASSTDKLIRVLETYSRKIHRMTRNIVNTGNPYALKELRYGLFLNPIPHEVGLIFQVPSGWRDNSVTHIPLIVEDDIGVHSKVILWDPLSKSDTHYHPSVHCFFTPVHNNGLSQSVLREDRFNERVVWDTGALNTGKFMYIHDTIGAHRLMNTSHTRAIASYHLYISEQSLKSDRA